MATAQLKDRVREQYSQLLEAFANLLRSARLPDEGGDAGSRQVSSGNRPRALSSVPVHPRRPGWAPACSWSDQSRAPACPPAPPPPVAATRRRCTLTACGSALLPPSLQGRVPGELMEVFAEKMLAACQALLGVVAELKRNALLNDVHGRNAEVRAAAASRGVGSTFAGRPDGIAAPQVLLV